MYHMYDNNIFILLYFKQRRIIDYFINYVFDLFVFILILFNSYFNEPPWIKKQI